MRPTPKANQIFCNTINAPRWQDQPDFSLSNSLDLWKISIKDQIFDRDYLMQYLSPAELERVSRYHQKKDKHRFIIGKGLLRHILSLYTGSHPAGIVFEPGINHKPSILHHALEFNVSYSNDGIIIGISREAIGVDIEFIHPEFDYKPLLDECFMKGEIDFINNSSNPRKIFYQFWTRKEALLKGTSLGLGDYLKDFSCLDGDQGAPQALGFEDNWHISSFCLQDQYCISIARKNARAIHYINGRDLPLYARS